MSELYRKESLERVNSPEQLGNYIRVANPSVWMVLAAIIVLLVGICVWGAFGHLDTTMDASGVCLDGTMTCYIPEESRADISEETIVAVSGTEYEIASIAPFPVVFEEAELSSLLPSGTVASGTVVYAVTLDVPALSDGIYDVTLITRRETPMSFVLN